MLPVMLIAPVPGGISLPAHKEGNCDKEDIWLLIYPHKRQKLAAYNLP